MKYYNDITSELQLLLVRRWVKEQILLRLLIKTIGVPISPKQPVPDIIGELAKYGETK